MMEVIAGAGLNTLTFGRIFVHRLDMSTVFRPNALANVSSDGSSNAAPGHIFRISSDVYCYGPIDACEMNCSE